MFERTMSGTLKFRKTRYRVRQELYGGMASNDRGRNGQIEQIKDVGTMLNRMQVIGISVVLTELRAMAHICVPDFLFAFQTRSGLI